MQADYASILSKVDRSGKGVSVQASTLGTKCGPLDQSFPGAHHSSCPDSTGSLEALITFLGDMKIPVSAINIGSIHKKDIMRAAVMLEHKVEYVLQLTCSAWLLLRVTSLTLIVFFRRYATILAFDVKIPQDVRKLAEDMVRSLSFAQTS